MRLWLLSLRGSLAGPCFSLPLLSDPPRVPRGLLSGASLTFPVTASGPQRGLSDLAESPAGRDAVERRVRRVFAALLLRTSCGLSASSCRSGFHCVPSCLVVVGLKIVVVAVVEFPSGALSCSSFLRPSKSFPWSPLGFEPNAPAHHERPTPCPFRFSRVASGPRCGGVVG